MIVRILRRAFNSTPPAPELPPKPTFDFALVRWICIYPWSILSAIFYYEYHQERQVLQSLASDISQAEAPAHSPHSREPAEVYPDVTKLTVEMKERLRAACIQEGVPPQFFNDFTKRLENQASLNATVQEACQDPTSAACSHFHHLAKLLIRSID